MSAAHVTTVVERRH